MTSLSRVKDFFTSYRGLIALIIIYETLVVLFLSTFSGPMIDRFGDWPVLSYIFPLIKNVPGGDGRHAARAILIYHGLAIPFMVAVVFFFMDQYEFRPGMETLTKWVLFVGAMWTSISAIIEAYFWASRVMHGLFISGQAIVFFGGILFTIGIWPTKDFPVDEPYTEYKVAGVNFEYLNVAITSIAILISSLIAAVAASFYGFKDKYYPSDPQTFFDRTTIHDPSAVQQAIANIEKRSIDILHPVLLESIVRREYNDGWTFYEMFVSHLHIMVALLAAAVMLYTVRIANMKVNSHVFRLIVDIDTYIWTQWFYLIGIIILSVGAWLVITPWEYAHHVIDAGAAFLLTAGLAIAIVGWIEIAKEQLGDEYSSASFGKKVAAIFKDPVKMGLYFQLLWVNFVVTFPGIYVGLNLDMFRSDEYILVEYSFNVGHWHVLATLIAVMVMLIATDYYGIEGALRKVIGWSVTLGSIFGFAFATKYMLRNPYAPYEFDWLMIDIGLGLLSLGVGLLSLYLLYDYLVKKVKN